MFAKCRIYLPSLCLQQLHCKRNVNINEECFSGKAIQWALFICQNQLNQYTLSGQIKCLQSHKLTFIGQLYSYQMALLALGISIYHWWFCREIKHYFSNEDKDKMWYIASSPFKGYLDMKCKHCLKFLV